MYEHGIRLSVNAVGNGFAAEYPATKPNVVCCFGCRSASPLKTTVESVCETATEALSIFWPPGKLIASFQPNTSLGPLLSTVTSTAKWPPASERVWYRT